MTIFHTTQPALDQLFEAREHVYRTDRSIMLVTVVEAIGSNPQAVGARLIVSEKGIVTGTVGGGRIEAHVLSEAKKFLQSEQMHALMAYNLQDLGMTCGGKMSFFYERIDPAPHLHLFGAGHIAAPTAALAAQTGFRVTVIDAREDWNTAQRFPNVTRILQSFPEFLASYTPQENHYLVMVSQGHAHDKVILQHVIGQNQAYTGVIGSQQKAYKLKKELLASGCSEEQWEQVHCPLGLPIGGDMPEEIAVSIVAQLIQTRRTA